MKARMLAALISCAWLLAAPGAGAQPGGTLVRVDPSLDELVAPDAQLIKVRGGFGFTEGITWVDKGGYLLLSDIPANVIYKLTPTGALSTHLHPAGYQGFDSWRVGRKQTNGKEPNDPAYEEFFFSGANGLALDPQGRLVICTYVGQTIERLEPNGKRTLLADRWEGKRFGGPNDIVVKKNGTIYFTDGYGAFRQGDKDPRVEINFQGIFMIKDGKVSLATRDVATPNGLALSPDQKFFLRQWQRQQIHQALPHPGRRHAGAGRDADRYERRQGARHHRRHEGRQPPATSIRRARAASGSSRRRASISARS